MRFTSPSTACVVWETPEPSPTMLEWGEGDRLDRRLGDLEIKTSHRVHLTGLVRPEAIPGLLAGFDILLHASRWEGLPRAAPQALLTEVPVVCFDNDGAPEVVEPGVTGELVRFGDAAGLAAAVGRLAKFPAERQRLGREGRRRCLDTFDHRKMVRRIDGLYRGQLG